MPVNLSTASLQVEALYVGYFGRAAEPGGYQYWVDNISSGRQTFAQAAAAFAVQAEARGQHPFLANNSAVTPVAFVESLYRQLYNRGSDAPGLAYWTQQLSAAAGNFFAIGILIAQFISGAQANDIITLTNKLTSAEYFTSNMTAVGAIGIDSAGQVTPAVDDIATS